MTRYGLIADPHGNHFALRASLERLRSEGVERIVCLGDIVGYNPGCNGCVDLLRDLGAESILGNHELIALGELGFERCADKVIYALRQTRRDLSASSLRYLRDLPGQRLYEQGRILVIHGGLDDSERYLRERPDIEETAAAVRARYPAARLCLFGHTHERRVYQLEEGAARPVEPAPLLELRPDRLTFINPGAVDASRRREPAARVRLAHLAILDSEAWTVRFLDQPYDHGASEAAARAAGYRITPAVSQLYRVRRWMRTAARAARAAAT